MSEVPGRAPPRFIMQSRNARPIEALARWPGPRAPKRAAIGPQAWRAGPLTISSGAMQWVVPCISVRSKAGSHTARTAATTTGMWSGVQPAMTAAMATFSTVAAPSIGPICPSTRSPSSPVASTMRSTRAAVGTMTGRPSVQPSSWSCSTAAYSSAASSRSLTGPPWGCAPDPSPSGELALAPPGCSSRSARLTAHLRSRPSPKRDSCPGGP